MAQLGPFILAVTTLVLAYLYTRLRYHRYKQLAGFPQLRPVSLLWGDLKNIHEYLQQGPPQGHVDLAFTKMREKLGNPSLFTIDTWPMQYSMAIICDHDVAEQVSKVSKTFHWSVPKSPTFSNLLALIGYQSILINEGEHWKALRRRFNPGFAPQHLLTLLPLIVDKTKFFIDHLERLAKTGEEFSLEYYLTGLTFDIIGAVVMDVDFGAQLDEKDQDETLTLYRNLMKTYDNDTNRGFKFYNPFLASRRSKFSRQLQEKLRALVWEKYNAERHEVGQTKKKSRSVLSLSLQGLDKVDDAIVEATCDQLKTFLFAGHDTTSILLQWAFYELSRTPRALRAIRSELDELFGTETDPEVVRQKLRSNGEDLVGKMTYTSAVIKETLRLHPPAATARYSKPGTNFIVTDPQTGRQYCLDGMVLYICQYIVHRDGKVFGETANEFFPERWLGDTDTSEATNSGLADEANEKAGAKDQDDKKTPASAWRPFERGPRNCIGQELANIEARVILACIVRRFDFIKVGLGELAHDKDGKPIQNDLGQYEVKEKLYQASCPFAFFLASDFEAERRNARQGDSE
ncbi:uncharacterized protein E0L32_009660 [Thyridium curvatum]|uniref:Cytochrome P450 n=1 Tax=Thyridium curvatum TaxID=1093900 RepID=A0A507AI52_9PEZI|nr:uncharacterized protein E0L32_009660 [Thyridium curvatum]TPX08842.1 hypothetical protein E0L32_009660 [Thyridium curvatum]